MKPIKVFYLIAAVVAVIVVAVVLNLENEEIEDSGSKRSRLRHQFMLVGCLGF